MVIIKSHCKRRSLQAWAQPQTRKKVFSFRDLHRRSSYLFPAVRASEIFVLQTHFGPPQTRWSALFRTDLVRKAQGNSPRNQKTKRRLYGLKRRWSDQRRGRRTYDIVGKRPDGSWVHGALADEPPGVPFEFLSRRLRNGVRCQWCGKQGGLGGFEGKL